MKKQVVKVLTKIGLLSVITLGFSGNLNIGNVNAGRIGQFQLRYVF
jgi:hypothetical protein